MTDTIESYLPATKKQRMELARLLKIVDAAVQDTENFDIDMETADHFILQLYKKTKGLASELD